MISQSSGTSKCFTRSSLSGNKDIRKLMLREKNTEIASSENVPTLVSVNNKIISTVNSIPRLYSGSGTSGMLYEIPARLRGKKISDLMETLEASMNDSVKLPIVYLENELFELARDFYTRLDYSKLTLEVLENIHPLIKLLDLEDYSTSQAKFADILSEYLNRNQNAFQEYQFLKRFIRFLNDLAISWNIVNVYSYRAMFKLELEYAKFLDIEAIFKSIINPEIIWLSLMVSSYPLSEVLTDEIKELANLVFSEFMKTLRVFMSCNKANLVRNSSIREWLSYRNPILHAEFSFPKRLKVPRPEYQELTVTLFTKIFRNTNSDLQDQLQSFELAYREFERSFILGVISFFKGFY